MAKELAIIEPITLPDTRRLGTMSSLPAWVESLLASAATESRHNGRQQLVQVTTLPTSKMPSSVQRSMLARAASDLNALCAQTPERSADAAEAVLVQVTKMLLVLAAPKSTETAVEAKGDAYMMALEDIPHWAVTEAVRKWYRGDCKHPRHDKGERHDTRWPPDPATLRSIAWAEAYKVKGRAIALSRLAAAQPRAEYTEEHCAAMRDQLAKVLPSGKPRHVGEAIGVGG